MAPDFLVDMLGEGGAELTMRALVAILILLLTWVISRLDVYLMRRLLKAIDRAADLMRGTDIPLDEQLEKALAPPLRFLTAVLGIWLAVLVLDIATVNKFAYQVANTLIAATIFWVMYRLFDVVAFYLKMNQDHISALDDNIIHFGARLAKAGVLVLAFVVIMKEWGYDLGALLAGVGLGGLAVALAAEDTLANLIGYFAIMADSPFEIGDYIVADKVKGTVETIGFRSTRLRHPDQSLAVVPNSTIVAATIVNWSRLEKRRLNMILSLSRDASAAQILAVVHDVREMLIAYEKAFADSVTVQFKGFGENALDIMIICMFDTPAWEDFVAAQEEVYLQIMEILDKHGVRLALGQAWLLERPASPSPMPLADHQDDEKV